MDGFKLQECEGTIVETPPDHGSGFISALGTGSPPMRADERDEMVLRLFSEHRSAEMHLAKLTTRQHQIMELILAGHRNKNIAADLGISQRTVENHRASIFKRTGSGSLPALARLAVAANWVERCG
jgi:DNA-binding NarL/FixJ family response regulator